MTEPHAESGIRCWSCGAARDLAALLDAAREVACQLVCDSFTVPCPDCRAEIWLDFTARGVAIGRLFAFGARPDVEDYQAVPLDAPVVVDSVGRTIAHAGRVWRYR
jgi:hypothetical protein